MVLLTQQFGPSRKESGEDLESCGTLTYTAIVIFLAFFNLVILIT
jgi:hypothetical protein